MAHAIISITATMYNKFPMAFVFISLTYLLQNAIEVMRIIQTHDLHQFSGVYMLRVRCENWNVRFSASATIESSDSEYAGQVAFILLFPKPL